ncbi:MAG: DUF5663 domain-containing protein [Syntrophobacteraceae bacterium]
MPERESDAAELRQPRPSEPVRNPYIVSFLKVLVEKKGENLGPEALKKLLGDMYRLFECMLGQNMIQALPEDLRQQYLNLASDLSKLDYDKIAGIFDKNVPDYERVMKETMKQFAEIFMKNRTFRPEDYPVPVDACQT